MSNLNHFEKKQVHAILKRSAHRLHKARTMRQALQAVRDKIDNFEFDECGVEQYTDTGDMWELLHLLRSIAEEHVGSADKPAPPDPYID